MPGITKHHNRPVYSTVYCHIEL